jgi:hypothetical protein
VKLRPWILIQIYVYVYMLKTWYHDNQLLYFSQELCIHNTTIVLCLLYNILCRRTTNLMVWKVICPEGEFSKVISIQNLSSPII